MSYTIELECGLGVVAAVAIRAVVALLGSCSSAPSLKAGEAERTYQPVLREVADGVASAMSVTWAGNKVC